jgi:hypothetical protein
MPKIHKIPNTGNTNTIRKAKKKSVAELKKSKSYRVISQFRGDESTALGGEKEDVIGEEGSAAERGEAGRNSGLRLSGKEVERES